MKGSFLVAAYTTFFLTLSKPLSRVVEKCNVVYTCKDVDFLSHKHHHHWALTLFDKLSSFLFIFSTNFFLWNWSLLIGMITAPDFNLSESVKKSIQAESKALVDLSIFDDFIWLHELIKRANQSNHSSWILNLIQRVSWWQILLFVNSFKGLCFQ